MWWDGKNGEDAVQRRSVFERRLEQSEFGAKRAGERGGSRRETRTRARVIVQSIELWPLRGWSEVESTRGRGGGGEKNDNKDRLSPLLYATY